MRIDLQRIIKLASIPGTLGFPALASRIITILSSEFGINPNEWERNPKMTPISGEEYKYEDPHEEDFGGRRLHPTFSVVVSLPQATGSTDIHIPDEVRDIMLGPGEQEGYEEVYQGSYKRLNWEAPELSRVFTLPQQDIFSVERPSGSSGLLYRMGPLLGIGSVLRWGIESHKLDLSRDASRIPDILRQKLFDEIAADPDFIVIENKNFFLVRGDASVSQYQGEIWISSQEAIDIPER